MMKTFNFNTGVECQTPLMKGYKISLNGVMFIPFDCEDVPDNAVFMFAADDIDLAVNGLIYREIHNSVLLSKYAFFRI